MSAITAIGRSSEIMVAMLFDSDVLGSSCF